MKDRQKPSTAMRWSAPTVFIGMTVGAFVWFLVASIEVVSEVIAEPASLSFNKGAFYMLGLGVALAVLSFVLAYEFWLGKVLTGELSRILTSIAVAALIVTFVLPHAAHYAVDSYLTGKGYTICEGASHRWLHSRTIVFVEKDAVCQKLLEDKR